GTFFECFARVPKFALSGAYRIQTRRGVAVEGVSHGLATKVLYALCRAAHLLRFDGTAFAKAAVVGLPGPDLLATSANDGSAGSVVCGGTLLAGMDLYAVDEQWRRVDAGHCHS